MALATRPRVLLLDEPVAGMGLEESQRMIGFLRTLRGRQAMILLSSTTWTPSSRSPTGSR